MYHSVSKPQLENLFDVVFAYHGSSYNGRLPRPRQPLGSVAPAVAVVVRSSRFQRSDEADVYFMWDLFRCWAGPSFSFRRLLARPPPATIYHELRVSVSPL